MKWSTGKPRRKIPELNRLFIREFIDRYRNIDFAHASEVLGMMLRNSEAESRITASEATNLRELQQTYRVRADYLAASPPKPNYPTTLVRDTAALAAALEAAAPQPVRIWLVYQPDGTSHMVFELLMDRRIAGCVASRDQRVSHSK